ncbi:MULTISPECIES: VWA domain-containing protein [unclassified Actinomyces]|uniref:vWA domain-containing protein n=1 Tax=unclassified Actinomyces TaxID=2609248 RepID=UPI002017445C|nr:MULTISPECIES: VWA domain-containing protein [unclassified Actinomyces]MCL3777794.1 VWA domain-containing protein [Actinomyces sp. AC-20-1]MCL3790698.1 VWA domain-containing protein [Actinomyces sp. 187325]MCL3792698.1 VWA domain-containing protein [Actinomyces sp. 186855]MCL3795427.1 VWA domain-containing protein [Actinomyces sp. 217892]
MRLVPVLPGGWWTVVGAALLMAALLALAARPALGPETDPGTRAGWVRRVLLAVVTLTLLAGPGLPARESQAVSSLEVYLLVDRTGSMAAEDWAGGPGAGGGTRLDGVKEDLRAVVDAHPGARFSIIALDSAAARELPLTSDVQAVRSWIDSLQQEVTDRSTGSSLERALPLLASTLAAAAERDPEDARALYVLSDGEATDEGAGVDVVEAAQASWRELGALVDAGAVLGYGTEAGGPMRAFDGSGTDGGYIEDPATGQPGVSVPDTAALAAVAEGLGVPYLQRDGTDDGSTSEFTDIDVAVTTALTDGRERHGVQRYLTWPLGLIASVLLTWELVHLAATERGLRRLTRPTEGAR